MLFCHALAKTVSEWIGLLALWTVVSTRLKAMSMTVALLAYQSLTLIATNITPCLLFRC